MSHLNTDLEDALDLRVDEVAIKKSTLSSAGKIGLIGGLAFRAGVFYYEQILQRHTAANRRLDLVLRHADVGTALAYIGAGDKTGLGNYLGAMANELFDSGACLVAVSAVAPHIAIEQLLDVARGPIVNVLDTIPTALKAAAYERVAVFGNRAAVETNVFGTIPGHMVVKLRPALIDAVHATYTDIALNGKRGTKKEMMLLDEMASAMLDAGAQAILLAGTDLLSFYADLPPAYPFIDVAKLHVSEIVDRALLL